MKTEDYIGKALVSMADGTQVGSIKDLIFDNLDVKSLVVRGEHSEGLLPFTDVGKNGPDAITIKTDTLVNWHGGSASHSGNRTVQELKELSVFDGDGNDLGRIHDFTLDAQGHLAEMTVRTGGVLGIGAHETRVGRAQVLAVGADLITVKASAHKS